MALVVTTVNGGQGRVVFGADGRPAHIIELGPVYIRLDVSDGLESLEFPSRGGYGMQIPYAPNRLSTRRARRQDAVRRGRRFFTGGLALGVPA